MDRDDYRFREDRENRFRQERDEGYGERYRASEEGTGNERWQRTGAESDDWRRRGQGMGGWEQGRYGEARFGEQGRYGEGRFGEQGRYAGSFDEGGYRQGRGWNEGRYDENRGFGEGRSFGEGRNWDEERSGGTRGARDWGYGGQYGQYGRSPYERFGVPREGYQSRDESYRPGRFAWSQGERSIYRGQDFGRFGSESGYGEERGQGAGRQLREFGGAMASRVRRAFRGPKGYRRSDERIREDVCDLLGDADDLDASDIEVTVSNGEVTLSGFVTERAMKWQAEQLADNVGGVQDIHNQIRVKREGTTQQQTTAGTQGTFNAGQGRGSQVRS